MQQEERNKQHDKIESSYFKLYLFQDTRYTTFMALSSNE